MIHDRFLMTDDRFRPQVMAAERALDELEDHAADRLGAARRAIQELERTATAALQERDTVPRVITADELKEGQTVAAWCIQDGTTELMAALGVVKWVHGQDAGFQSDAAGLPIWHNISAEGITIVLLEDA